MSAQSWIKVHDGLTDDPHHRDRMGKRIWFFLWLIKRVDWETGIVGFYTDAQAAEEMSCNDGAGDEIKMSPRTIERQRQELAELGYIRCHAGDQCQHIRIMKWRNPKLLNPPMVNDPADETTWYAVPRTPPHRKLRTPTIEDQILITPVGKLLERHFAFTLRSIALEPWEVLAETHGADELEQALIDTVNQGGGRRMNLKYVKAILERKARERNGNPEDVSSLLAAMEADINGR